MLKPNCKQRNPEKVRLKPQFFVVRKFLLSFHVFFFWQQSFFFFAKFIYDDFKLIRCWVRNFQIFKGLIILFYDEFSSDI